MEYLEVYTHNNFQLHLSWSYFQYQFLRCWIPNPGISCSKPLGGSKFNSTFHPSEVDKVSTRNFWGLSGKN